MYSNFDQNQTTIIKNLLSSKMTFQFALNIQFEKWNQSWIKREKLHLLHFSLMC